MLSPIMGYQGILIIAQIRQQTAWSKDEGNHLTPPPLFFLKQSKCHQRPLQGIAVQCFEQ